MPKKDPPYQQRTLFTPDKHVLFLCVDEWSDGIPKGRILNACFQEEVPFVGFGDMLLTIDRLYDQIGLSQSFVKVRQGAGHQKDDLPASAEWKNIRHADSPKEAGALWYRFGHARVFPIRIQHRMYATWQGVVQLRHEALPFRSALELLNLLDGDLRDSRDKTRWKERDIAT